jgi:molybdopterin converting factor small subunit
MHPSMVILKPFQMTRVGPHILLSMAFTKESTVSRSQLQQQLSDIFAAAKSNGYKFEEVIPEDMKSQFNGLVQLKVARTCIKEVEAREKELQLANEKLIAELEEKQQRLDCKPGELTHLELNDKQLNHQIDYYKKLAEDAQGRANRYHARLRELTNKQKRENETATQIKHLEAVIQAYDKMHVSHKRTLAMKDEEIAHLSTKMQTIETEKSAMDEITEVCSSLIDTLEAETNRIAIQLNHHSLTMQHNEKQVSAAVSELLPLNRFYDRAFAILRLYQAVFQRLADPRAVSITSLPTRELNALFRAADDDLYQYGEVHKMMQVEGLAQDAMRVQVEMLADHATRLHGSLGAMRKDTVGFLERIAREPSVWRVMKARFV